MSEILRQKLINRCLDLGLFLGQRAAEIINRDFETIERDYDTSVKMFKETEVPIEGGEVSYHQEEFLGAALDGHMDTLIKTVLNIIVSSVTEAALEENGTPVDLPDIVEYILANKEQYNLN